MRGRGRLALGGSIAVGLAILALILYYVGWREILREILALGWLGFLVLGADFLLTFFFWALAWRVILRAYGLAAPWSPLFRSLLSGYAVSYLTPSMYFGGEPVRVYIFSKELGIPQAKLYATVLVSKLLEAVGLIFFIFLGGFYALFVERLPLTQRMALFYGTIFLSSWVILGILNFTLSLYLGTRLFHGLGQLLPRRVRPIIRRVEAKIRELETDIQQAFHRFQLRATAAAFILSLIANLLIYLRPQIFFYFSQGIVFSFSKLSLLYALSIILATLFWITPGGIGIAEGGRIGIFALVGISRAGAVAFSFALKAIELVFVALGLSSVIEFGLFRLRRQKAINIESVSGPDHQESETMSGNISQNEGLEDQKDKGVRR